MALILYLHNFLKFFLSHKTLIFINSLNFDFVDSYYFLTIKKWADRVFFKIEFLLFFCLLKLIFLPLFFIIIVDSEVDNIKLYRRCT